ncbi:hypothetical protein [Streptomyces sp. NPDC039016]|uniref:hypothetical protein n=1 Tax=Streptomyces sp. NPDC039016 TaxID=3154330 RepID=UPI0033DDCD70
MSHCDCLAHRFGNAADHGDRERRYLAQGLLSELHDRLRRRVRVQEGRDPQPSAGIADSWRCRALSSRSSSSPVGDGIRPSSDAATRRRHPCRPPADTKPDQRKSSDHARIASGF